MIIRNGKKRNKNFIYFWEKNKILCVCVNVDDDQKYVILIIRKIDWTFLVLSGYLGIWNRFVLFFVKNEGSYRYSLKCSFIISMVTYEECSNSSNQIIAKLVFMYFCFNHFFFFGQHFLWKVLICFHSDGLRLCHVFNDNYKSYVNQTLKCCWWNTCSTCDFRQSDVIPSHHGVVI